MRWLIVLLAVACGGGHKTQPKVTKPKPTIMEDVAWLMQHNGRGSRTEDAVAVADRLQSELDAVGYETHRQPVFEVEGQTNVVGILRGTDEAIILVAHYDHLGPGYPGADDNASGTAVVLHAARALAETHRKDRKTLIILFTGAEEVGLRGAHGYVVAPLHPLDRTIAVINFDMVGRNFFELFGGREKTVAIVGTDEAPAVHAAMKAAADAEGMDLVGVTTEMITFVGGDWRSDDWVFRNKGIPAVHISTGLHGQYHMPDDTADALRPAQMVHIAAMAIRAVEALW